MRHAASPPRVIAPRATLPERRVRTRNLFRDAANRIHDDAVARRRASSSARRTWPFRDLALGPWIHVSSDVTHADIARVGDRLETRGRVARVYDRKGRGWVDLELLIIANGVRPIARARHTAIYHMPAPEAGGGRVWNE